MSSILFNILAFVSFYLVWYILYSLGAYAVYYFRRIKLLEKHAKELEHTHGMKGL